MPATDHPATNSLAHACDAIFSVDAPTLAGLVRAAGALTLADYVPFDVPEDLIGFVAPARWDGLALVATGTARHLDQDRPAQRTRVTYALDRRGRWASTVTTAEGTTRVDDSNPHDQPVGGLLADVCHRILGLPAAPEPSSPMDIVSAMWLTEVLAAERALGDDFPMDDWGGVLSLHPFGGRCVERTWDGIHRDLIASGEGWDLLDPSQVAWTDPPTLARLMLATLMPLPWLVGQVDHVAPPDIAARIRRMVGMPDRVPLRQ